MEKRLTIIIPGYNIAPFIHKIMSTLLQAKTKEYLEIIIVNDGSKDNTKELAQNYVEENPSIVKLIDKENGGHGSTINAGIKQATGKYFKVIDGDDWVDTEQLDDFVYQLDQIDDDMIICKDTRITEDGEILKIDEYLPEHVKYNQTYDSDEILRSTKELYEFHRIYYKTEIYRKTEPIDEHCFYVDIEYAMYPLPYVQTIRCMENNIYMYRLGREGQSISPDSYVKNKMNLKTVLLSLSRCVSEHDMSKDKKNYIKQRIVYLYNTIIALYFYIGDKKVANAYLMDIENTMKEQYHDIFEYVNCNKKVSMVRKTKYKGYWLLKFILKLTGKDGI